MQYLLNHLLEESTVRNPENVALVFKDRSISYGELDRLSNKLAHVLIESSVKRGDTVGLYLNKSIESIVSLFGILKAGGVYVPIDPNAPPSRAEYIIKDCNIKLLVTSTNKAEQISKIMTGKRQLGAMIVVDREKELEHEQSVKIVDYQDIIDYPISTPPRCNSVWTDLAYILYTSGSTGNPKGVMITHLNSLNFINWGFDTFDVNSNDVLSNHAPLHFDLSVFDLFVAMKAGATVAIVPDEYSFFPYRLVEWIHHNKITIWYSVPSILSMMVRQGELGRFKFKYLRSILYAGEVFPLKNLRELMRNLPHVKYYNLFGPTETNVITYYELNKIKEDRVKPVPIGRACENMEVFALDNKGIVITNPGLEGELYARGSNVAQGYWGDKDKTRRSFINNPLQDYYNEKVYKTGDIVTLDEEGNYIFIGRRDNMIKSRGFRIELEEVESVLYNHPKIIEAAVIAIPDEEIGSRIKAFVVLQNDEKTDIKELRRFCALYLPKYMIPENIEIMSFLPKTSTGKVNRTILTNA